MFQNLFNLHREFAFDEILITEHQISQSFQYRPSLISNIEKLRLPMNNEKNSLTFTATPTPKTFLSNSTSFSNRADIEAFQQKKESNQRIPSPIESNEIDLTKLIRDTYANNTYELKFQIFDFSSLGFSRSQPFKFSTISQNWQQQQKTIPTPAKKSLPQTKPCDDALLSAANKRFVLLYNMNTINILYIFDMQKDETKELPWIEGILIEIQSTQISKV